ncbi:MAG TPA: hypothetical protein VKY19_14100 [Ktedonosporobacter sp.]|jgi:hypothetical protein|nr:hypothetical protein [Ktedonosporobacter sp.]
MEDKSQPSWEEAKHKAQTAFSEAGSTIAADHIRRQRNVEFWKNEIFHEYFEDVAKLEKGKQPDLEGPER